MDFTTATRSTSSLDSKEMIFSHFIKHYMPSDTRRNIVHIACWRAIPNKLIIVKMLLDRFPFDVNDTDFLGSTALHYAVELNDTQTVAYLLSRGADPNIQDIQGCTALHLCATAGFVESAKLLLEAGSNPRLINEGGLSVMGVALHAGRMDFMFILPVHEWRNMPAMMVYDLLPALERERTPGGRGI